MEDPKKIAARKEDPNQTAGLQEDPHKTTDPQEDEKNGNILGGLFDLMHGDSKGGNSVSDEEADEPGNQESLKDPHQDK